MHRLISKSFQRRLAQMLASAFYTGLACWSGNVMAAPPVPVTISQTPLTVTIPAHPQILLALANSESMDGDLSGAIRTGSGSIPHPLLYPDCIARRISRFPGASRRRSKPAMECVAPYTVNVAGLLEDNSPSRLNVAKAGITAILNAYIAERRFRTHGLRHQRLGGIHTWVYQMSPPGGFMFQNTIPGSGEYVLQSLLRHQFTAARFRLPRIARN